METCLKHIGSIYETSEFISSIWNRALKHLIMIKANWNCNTTTAVDRNLNWRYCLPPTEGGGDTERRGGGLFRPKKKRIEEKVWEKKR